MTTWLQREISLHAKRRGFHLVTREILDRIPEIGNYAVGLAHIFIQHTSASLALNENADPTVRTDMEAHFNHMIPEN
ncbi:MAG: YjbQ family protein, partial [Candidatus Promineifilaceae bacterium]|nr:YjbQ family protein [Candidatus Promineifilaceae bacterium]